MTIVVTGGGSGGHITPILAVAEQLKQLRPDTRIVYISQSGDGLDDVVAANPNIDQMFSVSAGKFRRYNGEGLHQLLDVGTMLLNIRDGFRALYGLWQSIWLLRRLKPSIIFTRGSYVSVPVCLAAALWSIPYVTHDSDAIPSLTNRIIARWAAVHAVALPTEVYPYPAVKTVTVGVPISPQYRLAGKPERDEFRRQLRLDGFEYTLLVTGGGLGAEKINISVVANAAIMLKRYPGLCIVHMTGRMHENTVTAAYKAALDPSLLKRVEVKGFASDMYRYSGAASLVIARGGATQLAELAVQGKACIIIPNPLLTGGHQLKNTAALQAAGAIVQLGEDQLEQEQRLAQTVSELLDNQARLQGLGKALQQFGHPDAALKIARLLYETAGNEAV